jgi:hypothetical protein
MTIRFIAVALGAALSLSACQNETLVEQGPADPMANQLANSATVTLPPSIAASKSYRCDGNKVVEIDWTERDRKPAGANVRVGENATTPVVLTAPAEGTGPYTAPDGTSLTGTKDAASVNLTLPGQSAISCRG